MKNIISKAAPLTSALAISGIVSIVLCAPALATNFGGTNTGSGTSGGATGPTGPFAAAFFLPGILGELAAIFGSTIVLFAIALLGASYLVAAAICHMRTGRWLWPFNYLFPW